MIKFLYKLLGKWRLLTKRNFGLLGSYSKKEIATLGGVTWEDLQSKGDWRSFQPSNEYQRFAWGDTMACVTYSFFNCIETLLKRKYNEQWDFSDRYTAKVSGTTKKGNWMYKVFESFNKEWLSFLHWRNSGLSWNEYYAEIPETLDPDGDGNSFNVKGLAKGNTKTFTVDIKWIEPTNQTNLKDGLKQSPLWIAIYAYGKKVNGVYQRIEGHFPNHCVEMLYIRNDGVMVIKDHYLGNEIRLLAPDYLIGSAAKLYISKN